MISSYLLHDQCPTIERDCQEESRCFMLENRELCGADRSVRRCFLPNNFPSSHSNGLKRNGEGGASKGLIMNPHLNSCCLWGNLNRLFP